MHLALWMLIVLVVTNQPHSMESISQQHGFQKLIAISKIYYFYLFQGINGSNLDYFLRLTHSYRQCFPSHSDLHLEQIEQEVCKIAAEKGDSLEQLIGQIQ